MERSLLGKRPAMFTLVWEIENFFYFSNKIDNITKSPTFKALTLHKSDWFMSINPTAFHLTDQFMLLNLVKDECHDPTGCNSFGCEYSIIGENGAPVFTRVVPYHDFALNRCLAFPPGPTKNDVFFKKRSLYLPHDKLTVRLRMWKRDDNVFHEMDEHCNIRSAMVVDKAFAMWPIEGFSHVELNSIRSTSFHFPQTGCSFDVKFSLVGPSLEESRINLAMHVMEGTFYVTCSLFVLNQDTKAVMLLKTNNRFFGRINQTWTISDTFTRRALFQSGDAYLKFDIFCMILKFVVHSDADYQHVTSSYYRPASLISSLSRMSISNTSNRTGVENPDRSNTPISEMSESQLKVVRSEARRKLVFNSNPYESNASNYKANRSKYKTGNFKSKSGKFKSKAGKSQRNSDQESEDRQSEIADFLQAKPIDYRVPKLADALQLELTDTLEVKSVNSRHSKLTNSPQAKVLDTQHSKEMDSQDSNVADPQHSKEMDSQDSNVPDPQYSKEMDSQKEPKLEDVHPHETEESQSNMDGSLLKSRTPQLRRKLASPKRQRKKNKSQHKDDAISALLDDFRSLYLDRFLSDFELRTGDSTFPVHKVVLRARSPVFRIMFSNDLKKSGYLDVPDTNANILNRMLIFLYSSTLEPDLEWEDAAKLYQLAHRFQVHSLKRQCLTVLRFGVTTSNACDALRQTADRPDDDEFKSYVLEFAVKHFEKISRLDQWKAFQKSNAKMANAVRRLVRTGSTTETIYSKLRPRASVKRK